LLVKQDPRLKVAVAARSSSADAAAFWNAEVAALITPLEYAANPVLNASSALIMAMRSPVADTPQPAERLNSGVPATEVARRAGHGVAVLLKIYAHCIDGQATAANQRIAEALGTQDAEEDPGDEGDGDIEQAS
jgi:hypothetical protein